MKKSWREYLNISRIAIKYTKVTLFVAITIAISGIFVFSSLKYALFPEISFPVIIVNGNIPLETTLETEKQLTNPLENALSSIPELELMSSTYPGKAVINISFPAGSNLEDSAAVVKESLEKVDLSPNASLEEIKAINKQGTGYEIANKLIIRRNILSICIHFRTNE